MNKTLQQLAYRNVKKYKKHYLFVLILIFCVSLFFLSYTMIFNNQYEAKKLYNQDKYGTWYYSATLKSEDIPLFEKELAEYNDAMKYCYLYDQGKVGNDWIVCASNDNIYELYSLSLIEGRKLEKDNEILISHVYQQENQLSINDTLELTINNTKDSYTIVGILNVNSENYPSIYTNIQESEKVVFISNHELYRTYADNIEYIPLEQTKINNNGYSVSAMAHMSLTYDQIIILAEALVLTIFALIALNATSLKRRSKEFALLRGIGMTNKQLFAMIMYEIVYTTLTSIVLGFLSSFGVTFIASKILEFIYGYFVYQILITQILFYTLLLLSSILMSMIYPIYSSSKNSLSGTFDSQKFQHIQVRYRKLKYQSKIRLALRELGINKKITISLLLVLGVLSLIFMTNQFHTDTLDKWGYDSYRFKSFHYYASYIDEENLNVISDTFENVEFYKYTGLIDKIEFENRELYLDAECISIDNDEMFSHCIIEGRLPENDNEILLGSDNISVSDLIEDGENSFCEEVDKLSLNDTFVYKGQEMKVVGVLLPNESKAVEGYYEIFDLYYSPQDSIYITENAYNDLSAEEESNYLYRIFYNTQEEGEEILEKWKKLYPDYNPVSSDEELEWVYRPPDLLLNIDSKLLILPVLVGFIFLYYLNKNYLINSSSDIALSKLIGMTNKDLFIKQLCKAFIITTGLTLFNIFWIFMLNVYYNVVFIPILELVLNIIIVFIITIVIYCLPLKGILKNNVFDLIKGDE